MAAMTLGALAVWEVVVIVLVVIAALMIIFRLR
jgi:hypothetical protein